MLQAFFAVWVAHGLLLASESILGVKNPGPQSNLTVS